MEQIEILTTNAQVVKLAELLAKESTIAVDLEADSMHNYQEKVCLIQVSPQILVPCTRCLPIRRSVKFSMRLITTCAA
jgi:uncharacterized metal-binding protein YceD (DUF177 family)